MTILSPMTETEFSSYIQQSISEYAQDKVKSGQWSKQESIDKARDDINSTLPDGLKTANNYLFTLKNDENKENIGILWYAIIKQGEGDIMFIYDISIKPEYRHMGHATRAFKELEKKCRSAGLSGIGLHVFGFNTQAYDLYKKLGFKTTNINMFKSIE